MKLAALFLLLSVSFCAAQRDKAGQRPVLDVRDNVPRVNTRGCSNLTQVLDNWKFAIMTRVKDLLLHHHNTVLPDYSRIPLLSDALRDLYREFNKLKEDLSELTARLAGVEAFAEDLHSGRKPGTKAAGPQPQCRRKVIRRVLRRKVAAQQR